MVEPVKVHDEQRIVVRDGPVGAGESADVLAERVQRLELAVATLQDTRQLEERLIVAVSDRVAGARSNVGRDSREARRPAKPNIVNEARAATGEFIDTSRKLLPLAAELMRAGEAVQGPGPSGGRSSTSRGWLPLEVFAELRNMSRMVMDPRYRMTLQGRVAAYGLLPIIVLSSLLWYLVPAAVFIPSFILTPLDKVVDILLAYIAFKMLTRELARYRELVPDFDTVYGS